MINLLKYYYRVLWPQLPSSSQSSVRLRARKKVYDRLCVGNVSAQLGNVYTTSDRKSQRSRVLASLENA